MLKLDTKKYAVSSERKVEGDFGYFFITVRKPTVEERVNLRGMSLERDYQGALSFQLSLLTGWRELTNTDGEEIPYSPVTREMVLGIQPVLDAIMRTIRIYIEEASEILGDASAKKSEPLPESTGTTGAESR